MDNETRQELIDQVRDMREDGLNYSQIQKILGVKISKIHSTKRGKKHEKTQA